MTPVLAPRPILLWLLFAIVAGSWSHAAAATSTSAGIACEIESFTDLAQTGRPDLLTLRCDLTGSGSLADRVTVLDRERDLNNSSHDWRVAADFTDDVWIFDYQNDGKAELIADFHKRGAALVADLYDVPDGADRVDYDLSGGRFRLKEPAWPTVEVVAPDGWWTKGDKINFNLDIKVDGLVDAASNVRDKLKGVFKNDGVVDIVAHIRDLNGNGRPDYDWRTLHFQEPLPPIAALTPRTYLMMNVRDDEPPLAPTFPWPYLGTESYGYLTNSPNPTSQPPIQIDWSNGKIKAVGEFVRSRGNDGQWFVYSFNEVQPGQLTTPDFESPFAWYDLAQDRDRQPELAVRFGYYPPNDPHFLDGQLSEPINVIRYSWDQNNDGYWDYKLGLLGKHTVSSVVSLPEFDLTLVSYADLPTWIMDRSWGPVFFVAAETPALGEGIYVWDPPAWLTEGYFVGRTAVPEPDQQDDTNFKTIQAGFRGEYQYALQDKPFLYFSAVDHKLHLLKAQSGVWNIDDRSEIRYADPNNDGYFDQWIYTETLNSARTMTMRELDVASTHLLYSDGEEVVIRHAQVQPSLFRTLPPTDHQQWQALGAKLDANKLDFAPGDLKAMMQQFDGPEMQIAGASLHDYRPIGDNGFRFVLALQPDFSFQGSNLLNIRQLEPGDYAVTYNGQFTVEPLTPPRLTASIVSASLIPLEQNPIRVALSNNGLQDLPQATLELWVTPPQGQAMRVVTQTVTLLAQTPITPTLPWAPPSTGEWMLAAQIRQPDNRLITFEPTHVTVLPAKEAAPEVMIAASTSATMMPFIIAGLIAFAAIVTLVFWRQWRRLPEEQSEETT